MAELITGLDAGLVRERVQEARERISQAARRAGRDPAEVELLAAVKYVARDELGTLADAGLTLLGENRAQELTAKAAAYPGVFTWDFIGHLQSRKVRDLAPHVRYIHSVASDSALAQLAKHPTEVLVEVNVAGEASKSGLRPAQLGDFLTRCPVPVVGLMTMPPAVGAPERNRPHFAALRALAASHGLRHLSMGTSQDYEAAVEEGATIVRLGSTLYR
ncbi:MAG TPA: YggS family pyridoxal phosphate enzyme [Conexibacter sp.]